MGDLSYSDKHGIMKFLVLSALVAVASAQLVTYPNGAVVPAAPYALPYPYPYAAGPLVAHSNGLLCLWTPLMLPRPRLTLLLLEELSQPPLPMLPMLDGGPMEVLLPTPMALLSLLSPLMLLLPELPTLRLLLRLKMTKRIN